MYMKRKFILLPIALTVLTPMVSMVGCNDQTEIITIDLDKLSTNPLVGNVQLESEPILLTANTRYKLHADFSLAPYFYVFAEIGTQFNSDSGAKWGPMNVESMEMTIDNHNLLRWDGIVPEESILDPYFTLHTDRYHNPEVLFMDGSIRHDSQLYFTFTWWSNMPMEVSFVLCNRRGDPDMERAY